MTHTFFCFQHDTGDKTRSDISFLGTDDTLPNKWMKKIVRYAVARGTKDVPSSSLYYKAVNLAMTTWELECKLILKRVSVLDNPDIIVKWVPGSDDPYFGSDSSTLAWGGYPQTQFQGQLVLNDDKVWSMNGLSIDAATYTAITGKAVADPNNRFKTYNMNQTLRHEIGHLLGLPHSVGCPLCLMNPTYNGTLDPQPDDIARIQAKYGKRSFVGDWYYILKKWLSIRSKF